ncbi:MAG: hypothetical protein LC808_16985, partial [Actinobacteria bacterium]|nr:hypothetical protein [Actinomycetota bacterium]
PLSTDHLDADTQGLEATKGRWADWYSATSIRSTSQARTGIASLRVDVAAPYGWGVQLNNYPGFSATAGPKTIGFSGLAGSGSAGATMTVKWRNDAGTTLQTDTVALNSLGSTWRDVSADVVAPTGTTKVFVELSHSSGGPGDFLYVDDIIARTR